jgi:hypothetical protein
MKTEYCYEGSCGGYPLRDVEEEDLDYIRSHHDCVICGDHNVSDEIMYKTSMGWMHIDCFNEVVLNAEEDGVSEKPELI